MDLPGFAGSAHLAAPDSIAGLARRVIEPMDGLGVERFSLLGFFTGCRRRSTTLRTLKEMRHPTLASLFNRVVAEFLLAA